MGCSLDCGGRLLPCTRAVDCEMVAAPALLTARGVVAAALPAAASASGAGARRRCAQALHPTRSSGCPAAHTACHAGTSGACASRCACGACGTGSSIGRWAAPLPTHPQALPRQSSRWWGSAGSRSAASLQATPRFAFQALSPSLPTTRCRGFSSDATAVATPAGASVEDLSSLLQNLYTIGTGPDVNSEEVTKAIARLDASDTAFQSAFINEAQSGSVVLLQALSRLGAVPGRPYPIAKYFLGFLEEYGEELDTLRDGETISDRAMQLREVLRCFHLAGINSERLSLIYRHIERDFPRIEASGALLPMPVAVKLCHLMLASDLSSAPATVALLRSALREPLMYFEDDSQELRLLKMIEMLLRVDFLATQEQLPKEVSEYLAVVRSLRFYDRDLRRDTPMSYQLAYFLRKHSFPAKRKMLGPYALKVCDPEERINFEPVADRSWRPGIREEPPARKRRHLEAVGWRHIEVHESEWNTLENYEAKAAHVRKLLKDNDLLDP